LQIDQKIFFYIQLMKQ